MIFDENADLIDRMDERFRAEATWADRAEKAEPAWYRRLLQALVLAIGDGDIRYFTLNYSLSDADGVFSTDIVVLTDAIVAYATFGGDAIGHVAPFEVTALARRALTGFGVASTDDGDLAVSVSYPGFKRTLPLGESHWPNRQAETLNLIECLRQDLVA